MPQGQTEGEGMRAGHGFALLAGTLLLAGCGKIFPPGERLLPASYGPPFGSALKDNRPHHPHNPAADERHAQADAAQSRRYGSHQACHAALVASVSVHAHGQVERISALESVGHYKLGDVVHEQRCSDYVLSSRSWCVTASAGGGQAHKRAEPGASACGTETGGH